MATIRAYKLGALGQDTLIGIKCLAATVAGGQYMTLETPVGTDYSVSANYTFYITKLDIGRTSGTPTGVIIGYGDNGVAAGATPPTNWVALTAEYFVESTGLGEFEVVVPIPAGKYPCIYSPTYTVKFNAYGIEVPN